MMATLGPIAFVAYWLLSVVVVSTCAPRRLVRRCMVDSALMLVLAASLLVWQFVVWPRYASRLSDPEVYLDIAEAGVLATVGLSVFLALYSIRWGLLLWTAPVVLLVSGKKALAERAESYGPDRLKWPKPWPNWKQWVLMLAVGILGGELAWWGSREVIEVSSAWWHYLIGSFLVVGLASLLGIGLVVAYKRLGRGPAGEGDSDGGSKHEE